MNAHDLIFPDKGLAGKILLPIEGKYVRGIEGINISESLYDVSGFVSNPLPELENNVYFVSIYTFVNNISTESNRIAVLCETILDVRLWMYMNREVQGDGIIYMSGELNNVYLKSAQILTTVKGYQYASYIIQGYKLLLADL